MLDTKTVRHNGSALLVYSVVMEEMGLREGQSVTEEQMWQCIELNAAALVGEIEALRTGGEKNIPDTSSLEQSLNRIRTQR